MTTLLSARWYSIVISCIYIYVPGPFYCYEMPMDTFSADQLMNTNVKNAFRHGNPTMVTGKIGGALQMDGRGDYLDGGDFSRTCLGDLDLCTYGLTVSLWVKFTALQQGDHILDTGGSGVRIYYDAGQLVAEAQQERKSWRATWRGAQTGKWYYIELSWKPSDGLRMFVDLVQVDHAVTYRTIQPRQGAGKLYLGTSNYNRARDYASAVVDEVEMCYGDRARLLQFDFIQRGAYETSDRAT